VREDGAGVSYRACLLCGVLGKARILAGGHAAEAAHACHSASCSGAGCSCWWLVCCTEVCTQAAGQHKVISSALKADARVKLCIRSRAAERADRLRQ
jgi:hypothetical protein